MQIAYVRDGVGSRLAARLDPGRSWTPLDRMPTIGAALGDPDAVRAQLAAADPAGALGTGDDLVTSCLDPGATVVAAGLNFHSHLAELGAALPSEPFCFPKNASSAAPPMSSLVLPRAVSEMIDYEVELAVVVGTRVRDASESEAAAAIGGFAVANDVSARDFQVDEGGWVDWIKAKGLDGFLPLSPITVADARVDIGSSRLRCWVNDRLRQDEAAADMIFSPAALVAYVSRGLTLRPGDVVLSGTPGGIGHSLDPPVYLVPGDVVRCAIDGIGEIRTEFA
ncbi:MAG: fumarylacetoacetate hydrolase family protein [Pseudonocardiaceae bacterium]|nr:MAG: fumarylacetoacetate hydrolase family protein [Pseudonocardiaceae bacterium]